MAVKNIYAEEQYDLKRKSDDRPARLVYESWFDTFGNQVELMNLEDNDGYRWQVQFIGGKLDSGFRWEEDFRALQTASLDRKTREMFKQLPSHVRKMVGFRA